MRRSLILGLLLLGMSLVLPLGVAAPTSQALLTFGFLILAAYTVGEIVADGQLPLLFGYMLAGVLFGPSVLNIVTHEAIERLSALNQLAISLIALMAGAELSLKTVREDGVKYGKVLITEIVLTYFASFAVVLLLRQFVPALAGRDGSSTIVFAMLLSAIIVAHSPAATLAILSETRAKGPLAQTTLGVVLVSDVVLIFLFTLVAAAAQMILPPASAAHGASVFVLLWEVGGSVVVGALIGLGMTIFLRTRPTNLILFSIIIAVFGSEIARLAHVETMLTLLAAGFVAANFAPATQAADLKHSLERAASPFFVVFFALAGAAIPVVEVVTAIGVVGPLVLVRASGIWTGTRLGARWAKLDPQISKRLWMGLISQAGVALGLASVAAGIYPELGTGIRAMALAVIAIHEMSGPILFRRALQASGELR